MRGFGLDIPIYLLFEVFGLVYVAYRISPNGGIHGPGFRIQGLISDFASRVLGPGLWVESFRDEY